MGAVGNFSKQLKNSRDGQPLERGTIDDMNKTDADSANFLLKNINYLFSKLKWRSLCTP